MQKTRKKLLFREAIKPEKIKNNNNKNVKDENSELF